MRPEADICHVFLPSRHWPALLPYSGANNKVSGGARQGPGKSSNGKEIINITYGLETGYSCGAIVDSNSSVAPRERSPVGNSSRIQEASSLK